MANWNSPHSNFVGQYFQGCFFCFIMEIIREKLYCSVPVVFCIVIWRLHHIFHKYIVLWTFYQLIFNSI